MSEIPTTESIAQFVEEVRAEYHKMAEAFKGPNSLFAITHEGVSFLAEYQNIKDQLEAQGFEVPVLVEGVEVSLS